MRNDWLLILLALAIAAPGCCATGGADHDRSEHASYSGHHDDDDGHDDDDDDRDDEDEQEIALSAVPVHVLAAARAALPGATITEAETEVEDGVTVYELEAINDGREYEIEVSADGKVLEVEADDENDDDEDDD